MPSQMQFQHVIALMRETKRGTCNDKSDMFQSFHEKTNELRLKWGGGPFPRFQGQSDCRKDWMGKPQQTELFVFESNNVLETKVEKLMDAMIELDSGGWLNDKNELVKNLTLHKIANIRDVDSLSFPSL